MTTTATQFITCSRCRKEKLFTEFYRSNSRPNGRQGWCRKCINDYNATRAKAKRELKRTWGVVTQHQGKPYTAVFVAPYGFTSEATRAGIRMVSQ